MQRYEYKVVPAPARAPKVRGLRTAADRFAHALAEVMNAQGREGWEYLRADALPCEETGGLLSRPQTVTRHMLVFRRALPGTVAAAQAAAAPAPDAPAAAAGPSPGAGAADEGAAGAMRPAPAPSPALAVVPHAAGAVAAGAPARDGIRLVKVPPRAEPGRGVLPRLGGATGKGLFRPAPKPDAQHGD